MLLEYQGIFVQKVKFVSFSVYFSLFYLHLYLYQILFRLRSHGFTFLLFLNKYLFLDNGYLYDTSKKVPTSHQPEALFWPLCQWLKEI